MQWTHNGESCSSFKHAANGKEFRSSQFEIGPNINWQLIGYPNGKISDHSGNCQIFLCLCSFPSHFSKILIHFELICIESASTFSLIRAFKKVNDSTVWFNGCLKSSELAGLSGDCLSFRVNLNILRVEAKNSLIYSLPLKIDFDQKNEFVLDWTLSDEDLKHFQNAKHGKFVSSNAVHSDMWSMAVSPRGYRQNDDGSVRLFMQLCALPKGVKSIEIQRKLECFLNDSKNAIASKESLSKDAFGYPNDDSSDGKKVKIRQNSGWGKTALKYSQIENCKKLRFRATINIVGYAMENGKKQSVKKRKFETMNVNGSGLEEPKTKKQKLSKKNDDGLSKEIYFSPDDKKRFEQLPKIKVDESVRGEFEWSISRDLLCQFAAAKFKKFWESERFVVGGHEWNLQIYPSGHLKADKDKKCVVVYLAMRSVLKEEIAKMNVFWTLFCKESLFSFSTISEYTQKNNSFGIEMNDLKTMKCKSLSIAIGAKVTILNTLKAENAKERVFEPVYALTQSDYCKKCKFVWQINEEKIAYFKSAYNGKSFESDSFFSNMWSLRCLPNGDKKEDEGNVDLMLQCNALPVGIGKMRVIFSLRCRETETNGLFVHNFNVNQSAAGWNAMLKKTQIEHLDSLTFEVAIHIKSIYDYKFKLIKA